MKKWIALILVVTLLLAMSACGAKEMPSLADKLEKLPDMQKQSPATQETPKKPMQKPENQQEPVPEEPQEETVGD